MRVPGVDSNRDRSVLKSFSGLNNKADPLRGIPGRQGVAPRTWQLLQQADNVDINDAGMLSRRKGFTPFSAGGRITSSFSTFDFSRFYMIDGGALYQLNQDGTRVELAGGLGDSAFWAEVNGEVFLSAARNLIISPSGLIRDWGIPTPAGGRVSNVTGGLPAGVYQACFTFIDPDGREGGASPSVAAMCVDGGIAVSDIPSDDGCFTAIYIAGQGGVFRLEAVVPFGTEAMSFQSLQGGRELTNQFLDPPPVTAARIAFYQGQFYLADYSQATDSTVIWFSEPLGFHLFNHNSSFIQIPGRVVQMAATEPKGGGALMLSTERQVFLYNRDTLTSVADYGAISGQNADWGPDDKLYFWTKRGLCRVAPFENLTESEVSLAPGVTASGSVFNQYGYNRFVVVLKSGGAAFNKR